MKRTTSERAELEDIADSDRKRLKTTDNVKEKKRRRKKKKKHSIIDPNFRKNKLDVSRDDQSVQNITVNTGLPVQSPTPDLAEELRITTQVLDQHKSAFTLIQQSLTCQICLEILYKPYALSPCGHVACLICLRQWFTAPINQDADAPRGLPNHLRSKKTCPHCRASVRDRPAEIFMVKSMVDNLVRKGLLPDPSPSPEAADDPWHNIFHKTPTYYPGWEENPDFFANVPDEDLGRYDEEDGVYRCFDCMYEIEDGTCPSCGRQYPGHAFFRQHELSDEDDDTGFPFFGMGLFPQFLDEEASEDDDDDDDLGSFIQADDDLSGAEEGGTAQREAVDLTSDSELDWRGPAPRRAAAGRVERDSDDSDIEVLSEDEDEEGVRVRRRPQVLSLLSSDEEDIDDLAELEDGDETEEEES